MIVCLGTTPALQRTVMLGELRVDGVNRALSVREGASGKSLNVARVLRVLGEEALALGFAGGPSGDAVRAHLDAAAIAHDLVPVAAPTRICTTLLDRGRSTATEIVEEAAAVDAEAWSALLDRFERALESASVVVLSGTLAPGAPADFYGGCIRRAAGRGIRAIVDAAGAPLAEALAARPFVAKPNRAELGALVRMPVDSTAALHAALARAAGTGASWIVATLGPEGALVTDGAATYAVPAPRVAAINPVGSGDAVAAGLAAGIARGHTLPEAARLGVACGTANTLSEITGEVRLGDVERLLGEVQARRS